MPPRAPPVPFPRPPLSRILTGMAGWVARIVAVALMGALWGQPGWARQDDPKLDSLFAALQSAERPANLSGIEIEIWRIWLDSGDATLDAVMAEGIRAMNGGDHAGALVSFNVLVESAPDFAEGWNKRATLYWLMGDFEASVADIDATLALEPRHFGALSGTGDDPHGAAPPPGRLRRAQAHARRPSARRKRAAPARTPGAPARHRGLKPPPTPPPAFGSRRSFHSAPVVPAVPFPIRAVPPPAPPPPAPPSAAAGGGARRGDVGDVEQVGRPRSAEGHAGDDDQPVALGGVAALRRRRGRRARSCRRSRARRRRTRSARPTPAPDGGPWRGPG